MSFRTLFSFFILMLIQTLPLSAAERASSLVQGTQKDSAVSGEFFLEDTEKGMNLRGKVTGLTPGKHGFHVHEFGSCGAEGKDAGSHFNPHGAKHGYLPDNKLKHAHAGDFGNLEADASGTATIDITLPGLTVSSNPFSVAGRALIIHEHEDDFSQPLGNAGGRVGCGLITIAPKPETSNALDSNSGK